MRIGVDFDNTIVSYDRLFHRVACDLSLIPAEVSQNKTAVRDYLRKADRESEWTELQAEVYGARMAEADCFPGVREFLRGCRERGLPVRIISHKTRFPYQGPQYDLRAAARDWLERNAFFADELGLNREFVFFEDTKYDKLQRVGREECTHFIDDLPELLSEPSFPAGVVRMLFDPHGAHECAAPIDLATDWAGIHQFLLASEHGR